MTLVSEIITDAYRLGNLIALGEQPDLAQQTEGLRYVNRVVSSVLGNEAGELLQSFPFGNNNIEAPIGYPWYDQGQGLDWYLPLNKRVMLNLTSPATINLHPSPDDGARFGIVDVSHNLDTFNLTINGNGQQIENNSNLTLSVSGTKREWFYRQDLGNWVRTTSLEISDVFPFPESFDEMFVYMLALRFNPAYNATMDQQSYLLLRRARTNFQARYKNVIEIGSELGLVNNHEYEHNHNISEISFNKGLSRWSQYL
jgi:hypothetical protein